MPHSLWGRCGVRERGRLRSGSAEHRVGLAAKVWAHCVVYRGQYRARNWSALDGRGNMPPTHRSGAPPPGPHIRRWPAPLHPCRVRLALHTGFLYLLLKRYLMVMRHAGAALFCPSAGCAYCCCRRRCRTLSIPPSRQHKAAFLHEIRLTQPNGWGGSVSRCWHACRREAALCGSNQGVTSRGGQRCHRKGGSHWTLGHCLANGKACGGVHCEWSSVLVLIWARG